MVMASGKIAVLLVTTGNPFSYKQVIGWHSEMGSVADKFTPYLIPREDDRPWNSKIDVSHFELGKEMMIHLQFNQFTRMSTLQQVRRTKVVRLHSSLTSVEARYSIRNAPVTLIMTLAIASRNTSHLGRRDAGCQEVRLMTRR